MTNKRRLGGQPVAPMFHVQRPEPIDNSTIPDLGGKEEYELSAFKGVKLKNKTVEPAVKSPNQIKVERAERFHQVAEKAMEVRENRNQRMFSAAQKIIDLVKENTLKANRTQIQEELQNQARRELVDLAVEVNNDELEEFGCMGSVALINLLFKIILIQRDILNEQKYKQKAFEERLTWLEQELVRVKNVE